MLQHTLFFVVKYFNNCKLCQACLWFFYLSYGSQKLLMRTNRCHHFNDVGRHFDYRTPNLEVTESWMFEIFENKNSFDCYTKMKIEVSYLFNNSIL